LCFVYGEENYSEKRENGGNNEERRGEERRGEEKNDYENKKTHQITKTNFYLLLISLCQYSLMDIAAP